METTAKLRAIPMFSGLDDAALERIGGVVTEFEAAAGHVLIHAGMEGSGLFVVEEGRLTVSLHDGSTREVGPGEFVGELALLSPGMLRTARVQAATAVRCLAISRGDFEALLDTEPRIAVGMLPILGRRLSELT
jgi:CRP/FNR family cyclic AMP-dependent transcriptional regulator